MKILRLLAVGALLILSACTNKSLDEWTTLAEAETILIPALSNGKVSEMYVVEGEIVKKDQRLAIIDTLALAIQKQEIESAIAELNIQKSIFDIQLNQAQKDMFYSTSRLTRTQSLVESNSAPEQHLDDVNNVKEKTETNLYLLQKQKELLNQKQKQLEAKIKLLDKNIRDAIILAPEDGMISEIFIKADEAVTATRPVLEIINTESIDCTIYVNQTKLNEFQIGNQLKVLIDGYKESLTAKIIKINNKSEFTPKQILTPDTRTALVYGIVLRIDNSKQIIKDGMPIRIVRG